MKAWLQSSDAPTVHVREANKEGEPGDWRRKERLLRAKDRYRVAAVVRTFNRDGKIPRDEIAGVSLQMLDCTVAAIKAGATSARDALAQARKLPIRVKTWAGRQSATVGTG
jgi:hypothetical protein